MSNTFRITLWSGGKPVLVHYVDETPRLSGGCIAFRTDDGHVVRMMGSVSIEEGEFGEKRISAGRL